MKSENPPKAFLEPSKFFVGVSVFGLGLSPFHPVAGTVLAVAGTGAYLLERIFFPRTRVYRKSLYKTRALAEKAVEKGSEAEKAISDLRERLVRLENRGR
jgi:hypothetical protein